MKLAMRQIVQKYSIGGAKFGPGEVLDNEAGNANGHLD
jgi:hypothetical protein